MFSNQINGCFKTGFKEPIILSGKILGIKLLSAYEIILCKRKYKKLLKYLGCKKFLKQACLVSMCLYTFENRPMFFNVLDALKCLTPYELNFIYSQYIKISKESNNYNQKNHLTFESIKRHGTQQILQKAE